jgi:hypothetical protein
MSNRRLRTRKGSVPSDRSISISPSVKRSKSMRVLRAKSTASQSWAEIRCPAFDERLRFCVHYDGIDVPGQAGLAQKRGSHPSDDRRADAGGTKPPHHRFQRSQKAYELALHQRSSINDWSRAHRARATASSLSSCERSKRSADAIRKASALNFSACDALRSSSRSRSSKALHPAIQDRASEAVIRLLTQSF